MAQYSALAKSLQPCILPDPTDYSPPRLLCPWDSPNKNTGVGSHALLHPTFPTQGSDSSLLHWQSDSLPLSHQRSPQHLAWRGKSSKRKKGPDSRRGLRLSGALAWTRVTQLSPRGAPDWLKPVALTRVFRNGGGPSGRKTSGISRSRRVCPAGWRLLCFTRGCPEMRPLRALRSRRWARRGPGKNAGRFLLCVREQSTGPGLGERS